MVRPTLTRLLTAAVVLACCIYFFATSLFGSNRRGFDIWDSDASLVSPNPDKPTGLPTPACSPVFSGVSSAVAVVLKLGAAEVSSKLRLYLDGYGSCLSDPLIFSDYEEQYDGHHIHDALSALPAELRDSNPDFHIYADIQEKRRAGVELTKTDGGWQLDKYKFLPMMEKAWDHFPLRKDWYFFIELDTYVNWDNLHRFLARFDPQQPYYFGSPVWPKNKPVFAHGGSGFILSRGALQKLIDYGQQFRPDPGVPGSHQFGKDLTQECCGDELLARILQDCGVRISGFWPMFNGEKPTTVRFSSEQYCEAIITLHHLSEYDFGDMQRWEASRKVKSRPLTFEELFDFIEPELGSRKNNWTNLSEDFVLNSPHQASTSFDDCYEACIQRKSCVQYELKAGACRLSYAVRLGYRQTAQDGESPTAGWLMDRVAAFKAARPPCKNAHFVHQNP